MMTGLGRVASKVFGLGALEIPWIGFGKTRGLKPRIAGMIVVPFRKNPGDGLAILGKDNIEGAKPSIAGRVCSFFGADTPDSTGDSIISLITTQVGGASILILGGTLQRHSCKYSSQSFLNPINIVLWLVLAWVFGGHRLVAMQSLLHNIAFDLDKAMVC